jgi:hypothetical protein
MIKLKQHGFKKGMKRLPMYSTERRREVRERIMELKSQGCLQEEIADIMNSEGFKTPTGQPLSKNFIQTQTRGAMKLIKKYGLPESRRKVILKSKLSKHEMASPKLNKVATSKPWSTYEMIESVMTSGMSLERKLQVIKTIVR